MKKIFLMLLFLIASTQTTPAKGEEMDQFISKATMTLEEFNQYEDFLELPKTVQRIDIEKLKENGGLMVYTLPNGITVRRDDWVGSYADDLTFPKSPFLYRNHYDTQGYLKQKVINFYGENFGFAINFDQHGNMIKKIDIDTFPQLKPHELREVMLDRNGIDIYVRGEEYEHKAKDVWLVLRSQVRVADTEVYEVYVFTKDNEREIEAYLINGETGEQIYVKKYQGPPSLSQTTLGMDYYKEIQPEKYDEYRRWNEDTMGGRIPPRSVELKLPDAN